MTRDEIIDLENEVIAFTGRLKAALKATPWTALPERDFAGTLWLNVRALERAAGCLEQSLAARFAFKGGK